MFFIMRDTNIRFGGSLLKLLEQPMSRRVIVTHRYVCHDGIGTHTCWKQVSHPSSQEYTSKTWNTAKKWVRKIEFHPVHSFSWN
jgi:hypothetical protein